MIDNTKKITSTGEPVTNQAPAPAEATSSTPDTSTPDSNPATAPAETTPATLEDAAHAAHRQRVEELKKSLTSYSNTATPATAITADTPAATPADAPVDASATADAPVDASATADAATDKETAPATATPAPANATTNKVPATLPSGYCANGSMVDADGIMLSEYIGEYARELAQRLKPLKASTFQRSFLTKAKDANKKKVAYTSQKNCTLAMEVEAIKLVNRKKDAAPRVLLDMIRAATATVTTPESFAVMYSHLDAVYGYLLQEEVAAQ